MKFFYYLLVTLTHIKVICDFLPYPLRGYAYMKVLMIFFRVINIIALFSEYIPLRRSCLSACAFLILGFLVWKIIWGGEVMMHSLAYCFQALYVLFAFTVVMVFSKIVDMVFKRKKKKGCG